MLAFIVVLVEPRIKIGLQGVDRFVVASVNLQRRSSKRARNLNANTLIVTGQARASIDFEINVSQFIAHPESCFWLVRIVALWPLRSLRSRPDLHGRQQHKPEAYPRITNFFCIGSTPF